MTRRERTLALCVAGALGAFGLYKAGRLVLWAPVEAQRAGLVREQARAVRLQNRLKEFERAELEWQTLTRRTLSTDPTDAQRRFREDIQELLEVHGLRNPKVTPGNFAKRKNEFVDVPLTITASGTLKEIVGFLTDFYRRDYLARLDAEFVRGGEGAGEGSPQRAGKFPRRQDPATLPHGPLSELLDDGACLGPAGCHQQAAMQHGDPCRGTDLGPDLARPHGTAPRLARRLARDRDEPEIPHGRAVRARLALDHGDGQAGPCRCEGVREANDPRADDHDNGLPGQAPAVAHPPGVGKGINQAVHRYRPAVLPPDPQHRQPVSGPYCLEPGAGGCIKAQRRSRIHAGCLMVFTRSGTEHRFAPELPQASS